MVGGGVIGNRLRLQRASPDTAWSLERDAGNECPRCQCKMEQVVAGTTGKTPARPLNTLPSQRPGREDCQLEQETHHEPASPGPPWPSPWPFPRSPSPRLPRARAPGSPSSSSSTSSATRPCVRHHFGKTGIERLTSEGASFTRAHYRGGRAGEGGGAEVGGH